MEEISNLAEVSAANLNANSTLFVNELASSDPAGLFALAESAMTGNFLAEEVLLQVEFDVPSYQLASMKDPTVLPQLALLAEMGCGNVQRLLAQLLASGPQDFFFNLAGVAIEGSNAAFSVLNEGARFDHLASLIDFLPLYHEDEVYGPMLRALIESAEFCPRILELAATGDSYALGFAEKLADWGNPFAAEFVPQPKVVGLS
ncbi:MAG TPA: hypothetical protein VFW62_12840 [bacterium]|nr:hypothetical protein [bacterium]